MNCNSAKSVLYRLWDKELGEAEKSNLEAHVGKCQVCQREAASIQAFHELFKGVKPEKVEVSSHFEPDFWKKAMELEKEPVLARLLRRLESLIPTPTLAQALAILVLAFFIGGASGAALTLRSTWELQAQGASIRYLSGFQEFKGVPASSVAANYLKAVEEGESA